MSGLNQQIANLSYIVKVYRGFESPSFRHIQGLGMNRYQVTYFLEDEEYVVVVTADNTGDVFGIIEEQEPDASDIRIVRIDDD